MSKFTIEPDELYYSMRHFRDIGCGNQYYRDQEYNGRTVNVNGRELLHFANCGYLGLEKHPILLEHAIQATKDYGTQNSMSRSMLSSPLYLELETILPQVFSGYSVVYSSTTLAHCSALPLLIKEHDAIILDAYVHNSVRMASQLCKANGTFVLVSKHNDIEHVRYLVKRLKKEGKKNIWYCADGVYSMHGDVCDVAGLNALLDEEDNFYAYVDDAHGLGWCGKHGSGYVIGNYGLHEKMIVAGSLSKSLAGAGGIVISPDKLIADYLRFAGQTSIFSGPIQPAPLGALIASLKLHLSDEIIQYQRELTDLVVYFQTKCKALELPLVTHSITPIQLLKIGKTDDILYVQQNLIEKGFFPTVAAYPAISKDNGGIRVSLTRHLRRIDIDNFLTTFQSILSTKGEQGFDFSCANVNIIH